ncbi:winged helix-turn-helix domain-containing protein, partial [Serratia ureilytica]|uniref:winged helix-turn-helix domain-containing protein n=2 Tax=Pseudomonadota TaxID=1224 RepID=UPI00235E65DB
VWADGVQLILKRRELALIESLIRRAGRVIQRASLIDEVYGFDDEISSNTLDSHISRLRAKLAEANAGVAIHPVRGVGYILDHD